MIPDALLAQAAAADSAALAAAAGAAEEALACHRDALAALAAGWHSETGSEAAESLQRKCAEATDIVAELHRAAAALSSLHDGLVDLAEGGTEAARAEDVRFAEHLTAETSSRAAGIPMTGPIGDSPASPPEAATAVPAASLASVPWATQAGGGSWAAPPSTAPSATPAWQPGGSVPALPDLGGALVGLVAQIAQTLGPYAGNAETRPAEVPAEKPPLAKADPRRLHRKAPPVTPSAVPAGLPDSAVPKSAAPQPQPATPTPSAPTPELLAAERQPEPGQPPEPPPVPVGAPVPQVPPVPDAPPPAPAEGARTPCEIAADELPKVGE